MVKYNMKTDKRVLIEYGDGTHEFVKAEDFLDWNEIHTDSEKSRKLGIGIKMSRVAGNIIFG